MKTKEELLNEFYTTYNKDISIDDKFEVLSSVINYICENYNEEYDEELYTIMLLFHDLYPVTLETLYEELETIKKIEEKRNILLEQLFVSETDIEKNIIIKELDKINELNIDESIKEIEADIKSYLNDEFNID